MPNLFSLEIQPFAGARHRHRTLKVPFFYARVADMKILSIETSADESAVSIVEAAGDFPHATYELKGNAIRSQIEMHREYGGIFPSMAKREHAKALTPLLQVALEEAGMLEEETHALASETKQKLVTLLEREPELTETLTTFLETHEAPEIDMIAVTSGPGLEPALWVGVNFAKALALVWNLPVVPVNHMEGHLLASIFDVDRDDQLSDITFPAISLLISGGHTELIHMNAWSSYEKAGGTLDDAVGEAYDKVARLLDLPYPGGPEIEKRAKKARTQNLPPFAELPRPMLKADNLDFSFSGLKTAVRYALEGKTLTEDETNAVARDFEDAVTDVLLAKTERAIEAYGAKTLIVGGGVSASGHLRQQFNAHFLTYDEDISVYFPMPGLSTDNSIMIALAGHAKHEGKLSPAGALNTIRADGNKRLT